MSIDLDECKQRLPLPALCVRLGLGERDKGKTLCPLHVEKTPSFTVFRNGDSRWHYKCFGCGEAGDEITLIEKLKGLSKGDAIRQFASMAGVTDLQVAGNGLGARAATTIPKGEAIESKITGLQSQPVTIAPLTEEQVAVIANWRGLSLKFVADLSAAGAIGTFDGGKVAFPLANGGVHYRMNDGSWRYAGGKAELFEIGDDPLGLEAHVFESQWDAMCAADALGLTNANYIATRGAANAKLLQARLADWPGVIYVWPQYDNAGTTWEFQVKKLFPQVRHVSFPTRHKDLNEWRKAGATDSDIKAALQRAASPPRERLADISDGNVAADNLPVLVTAEPETVAIVTHAPTDNIKEALPIDRKDDSSGGGQSLSQTLDDIVGFLTRYVTWTLPEQADVIALWVAHTHVFSAFRSTPYINVYSPEKECGKTRVLECASMLVARPWFVGGASESILFRYIDAKLPTVLFDEIDEVFTAKNDQSDLKRMFNIGYKVGAKIARCEGKNHELREFSVFCPKMFSGIGHTSLPDATRSRSIGIEMARQGEGKRADEFIDVYVEKYATPIREALEAWASADVVAQLSAAMPEFPAKIRDRKKELSWSLVAIADLAGGEWPKRAREALLALFNEAEVKSISEQLLSDCREIFERKGVDSLSTAVLLGDLIEIENASSPWADMWERDVKNNNVHKPGGKLAKLLKRHKIKPRAVDTGVDDALGYWKRDFADAWARYLPPLEYKTGELL